jgi:hypothetical protein
MKTHTDMRRLRGCKLRRRDDRGQRPETIPRRLNDRVVPDFAHEAGRFHCEQPTHRRRERVP